MSAAKAASAVALDTRTGTRVAKTTESIAYDTAWGGASSGTLKVNGTAVSGLSSKGTYSWTPNSEQTNYWALTYTAGTANYSATFKHSGYYAITYANTKGAANSNPAQYNIDSSITFTPLLWEQLSRANRVRFCPSAFRVAMALQLIDASAEDALPQKSQLCLTLIRNPQPSPRLHCIVRLQGCNLAHALMCRGVLALTWDGTS